MRRLRVGLIVLSVVLLAIPVSTEARGAPANAAKPRPTPSPTSTPSPTPSPTPPPGPGFTIISSPNPDPSQNRLDSVAVVSATDAWAVGRAGSSTLAEHWNGSQWSVVPTPNVAGAMFNELKGVAAVSSTDVWAAGYASTTTNNVVLTEHWNGTQWSMVLTPQPPAQSAGPALNAIAAVSSNDVWAVGGSFEALIPGPGGQAVLMHWDGHAWSLTPAPSETSTWSSSTRFGVAAVSTSDVWAIGDFESFHWNGTAWSVVFGAASTTGVTTADATDVWAVGTVTSCDNEGGGCTSSPVAYRWNGSQWLTTSPVATGSFAGTGAISATDIWAVGGGAQNWNGSAWSVVPTASLSGASNAFLGVAGSSADDVWAVGYSQSSNGVVHTLVEHFAG